MTTTTAVPRSLPYPDEWVALAERLRTPEPVTAICSPASDPITVQSRPPTSGIVIRIRIRKVGSPIGPAMARRRTPDPFRRLYDKFYSLICQ